MPIKRSSIHHSWYPKQSSSENGHPISSYLNSALLYNLWRYVRRHHCKSDPPRRPQQPDCPQPRVLPPFRRGRLERRCRSLGIPRHNFLCLRVRPIRPQRIGNFATRQVERSSHRLRPSNDRKSAHVGLLPQPSFARRRERGERWRHA